MSNKSKEARLTVFGQPVPKARPRVVNGHAYTPQKTKVHEESIALIYKTTNRNLVFDVGAPLRIVMDFYMQIPKSENRKRRSSMVLGEIRPTVKPDTDNLCKTVMDALHGVAYKDDNQVVEILGRKFYSEKPRTEIYIAEIGEISEE